MTRLFHSDLLDSHDLYHARYGRGAVIVAIRRFHQEAPDQDGNRDHLYMARLYNAREPGNTSSTPNFDRVLSVREESGFARLTLEFEHRNQHRPSYDARNATIERVISLDQITLEIIRDTKKLEPVRNRSRFT